MDELGVEGLDLLLEQLLLLALLEELVGLLLEGLNDLILVLLDPLLLLLELDELGLVNDDLVLLLELRPKPVQLVLVLPDQGFLVQVFVYERLVLYALGAVCKF